ncbi:MAG: rhodanese-like domain-containing protein [Planctomycetota bacterium]|jgi:3-mercaptopyruvate sulfurtransferase SseA
MPIRRGLTAVAVILATVTVGSMIGCMERKTSDRDLVLIDTTEATTLVEGRKKLLGLAGATSGAWVDPRGERAYREGHIPGAINLPFQYIATRHQELKGYDVLIVYGNGYKDPIAEAMSKRLMELKHKDVRTLRGGLRAWTEAGLELETGDG